MCDFWLRWLCFCPSNVLQGCQQSRPSSLWQQLWSEESNWQRFPTDTKKRVLVHFIAQGCCFWGMKMCKRRGRGKQNRCMYGKSKHSSSMLMFWLRLDSSWGDSVRFANLSTSSEAQPRSWIGVFSLPQHWSTFSRGQITMVTCFCCFQRKLCSK